MVVPTIAAPIKNIHANSIATNIKSTGFAIRSRRRTNRAAKNRKCRLCSNSSQPGPQIVDLPRITFCARLLGFNRIQTSGGPSMKHINAPDLILGVWLLVSRCAFGYHTAASCGTM
jgi:hypothetical protein